jgi:hypothetical protein
MSVLNELLLRMFGHPRGALGRLGGRIMARSNAECGFWVSDLFKSHQTIAYWKWVLAQAL